MVTEWIEQYLDREEEHRRRKTVTALAKVIYPRPWGDFGDPDDQGLRRIKPGRPNTALGYAAEAFDVMAAM